MRTGSAILDAGSTTRCYRMMPSTLVLRSVIFALASLPCYAQPNNTTPNTPEPIPASEIAIRAEELALSLADISQTLLQKDALAMMQEDLAEQSSRLQQSARTTRQFLAGDPTSLDLRAHERQWLRISRSEAALEGQLADWMNKTISDIRTLDQAEITWKATLDSISSDLKSAGLREVSTRAIADIQMVRTQARGQVNRIASLQQRAASSLSLTSKVQKEITQAEASYKSSILARNADPIWRSSSSEVKTGTLALITEAITQDTNLLKELVLVRPMTTLIVVVTFLLLFIFTGRTINRFRKDIERIETSFLSQGVISQQPFAVAFILPLPIVLALMADVPLGLLAPLVLFSFVPILRVLINRTASSTRLAYFLIAIYALAAILDLIPAGSPLRRVVLMTTLAAVLAGIAWIGNTHFLPGAKHDLFKPTRTMKCGVACLLAAVLVTLGASVLGYLSLAQFLRQTLLYSCYLALLLMACARVSTILVIALLQRVFASPIVRMPGVKRWVSRIFRVTALLVWLIATVNLLLLRSPLVSLGKTILSLRFPGRLSVVTLGDLLGAVAVFGIGILMARAFRFVLRTGVLSRMKFERGMPELISNLAYYLALLFVFLAAIRAIGVDLSKLTLLTGAFGVGLGFGMQNVVNNFVCGLILQFERPIHTGDVIEVAGQIGEVQRIGIRSTTIRTPQGAELIVPNASLVSSNVVNWTLTRPDQQIRVPVLVGPGAVAGNIIELLVDAAEANPAVSNDPQPTAYLKNSGANGLLFELSFSIDDSASQARVREKVASAVFHALSEAHVSPFRVVNA